MVMSAHRYFADTNSEPVESAAHGSGSSNSKIEPTTLRSRGSVRFANILFTTDLSPAAEKALPFALEFARRYQSTIYASYVGPRNFPAAVPPAAWPKFKKNEYALLEEGRRLLNEQLQDVRHEVIFETGETWPTLEEIICDRQIDLVVSSTHGRTGAKKAVLGSVAEQIFRHARCPVLTVGPAVFEKPQESAAPSRILYATDFSAESLAGAPYAISLAREHRAQLILFHCLKDGGDVHALSQALHDIVPFGSDLRNEPDCIVERGIPSAKIIEVAEGHSVEMIVLGIHGADGHLARAAHFGRSGTYQIVTQAKCAVLTVRG